MKVYLDTNILIDFVCKRVPFYEGAKRLFALGSIGQFDLVTSSLSIVNTIYIGRKYELPIVKQRIKSILSFISVCDLQADVVIKSLDSDWKDYEDSVQSMTALETFFELLFIDEDVELELVAEMSSRLLKIVANLDSFLFH